MLRTDGPHEIHGVGPRLIVGDLWAMASGFEAIGIPTNGKVNSRGDAVMGAGVARTAAHRWRPWLVEHLGAKLTRYGNSVHVFEDMVTPNPAPRFIFSFPTKHSFKDMQSDMVLIHRSCEQLMAAVKEHDWKRVIMPQPGTGMGKLSWSDVWTVIAPILDNRVTIVTRE